MNKVKNNIFNSLKDLAKSILGPNIFFSCKKLIIHFFGTKLSKLSVTNNNNSQFAYYPMISIICPVFNPDKNHLITMIDSIIEQHYENWELCLYNASYDENLINILNKYKKNNKHIKVKRGGNLGISANSNEALKMANGEYIALMDHDDILLPHALREVVHKINETNAEFIYSDEALFFNDKYERVKCHYKSNFNIELLRRTNYICHFSVIKTSLLNKINGFNNKLDGSQDHDLFLRCAENTTNISHINKVLYLWRIHNKSFSKQNLNKCVTSGIIAVQEHLKRCKIEATVTPIKNKSQYKVVYKND